MNITNLFKVSLKAVANNKMRSFLSMLGIIIGVAAVIIMMSIGQGSKESIRAELSTMGTNLLTIRPGADMRGGVRQDPSSMQTLKMADYQRILQEKKFVTKVSPEVTASGQAIYGNNNTLCENNDKFAIDRSLPAIDRGDLLYIHDTGAHGFSMGYNYNGKLWSAEVLLSPDGSFSLIRRAQTPKDYFATLDFTEAYHAMFGGNSHE